MAACWNRVLGRDGTVLAAAGGAPTSWIGGHIMHCNDAPAELKTALDAILARTARTDAPITDQVSIAAVPQPVTITVVDAIPLRRASTDIRALLCCHVDVHSETKPFLSGTTIRLTLPVW